MKKPRSAIGAFLPYKIWRLTPLHSGYARRLPVSFFPPRIWLMASYLDDFDSIYGG